MKHSWCAGLIGAVLLQSGCQSMNWTANNKSSTKSAVAQSDSLRESSRLGSGKKKSSSSADLPPEIAAKFEKGKFKSKSAAEWVTEGAQQETAHDLAAARKSYEAALSLDPENADAHHRLGILADMRSDFGTAQEHYEAALRQKPRDANLLSDIGYSNHLRGNAEAGERFLLQALEADSKHRQALKNLGTLYASQNRYEDALATFRRCRPDEAQQLITQYFPHGRPIPQGNEGQTVAAQGLAKPQNDAAGTLGNIDQAALSRMSREEIYQLIGRLQQQQAPDQQSKSGSSLPTDQNAGAFGATTAAAESEWPAISSNHPANRNGQAPGRANGFDGSIQPAGSQASMASQRDPKSEMPFWEGASRQPRSNSQQASTGPSPANKDLTAGSRNLALPADLQPSLAGGDVDGSWWSAGAHPEDKSSSGAPAENASWNVENTASNTSLPNNSVKPNSSTVRPTNGTPPTGNDQWAYQLGMSAGPGTLFPVMANYAPASGVAMEAVSGPMGSLRGGSSDARSAAPAGNFIPVDTDQRQWQTVPIENAPRNPAENSGSSTTVPWPDNSTSQIPRGSAGRTAKSQPMPVITPGGSSAPWGTTAANTPRRNDAGGATAGNPADGVNAGVVPAWYDVPASNKSNGSRPSPANAGGEFSPSAGQ